MFVFGRACGEFGKCLLRSSLLCLSEASREGRQCARGKRGKSGCGDGNASRSSIAVEYCTVLQLLQ